MSNPNTSPNAAQAITDRVHACGCAMRPEPCKPCAQDIALIHDRDDLCAALDLCADALESLKAARMFEAQITAARAALAKARGEGQ